MSLSWMKFETAAWIQDTRVLSPLAKGAWIDLICFMFSRDKGVQGSLTHTVEQFGRMTGLTADEMAGVIEEFRTYNICTVTPDVTPDVTGIVTLMSRRITRDCHKRMKQNDRKRKERSKEDDADLPKKPHVTQDVTQDVTPPVTGRGKSIEVRDKSIPPVVPQEGDGTPGAKRRKDWSRKQLDGEVYGSYPGFLKWWGEYPSAKGKRKAFEAWVKQGLEFEDQIPLFKVLNMQKKDPQWTKDGGEFIPHASTYLNQRMYEDDPGSKKSLADPGESKIRRFAHG